MSNIIKPHDTIHRILFTNKRTKSSFIGLMMYQTKVEADTIAAIMSSNYGEFYDISVVSTTSATPTPATKRSHLTLVKS